MHPAAHTSGKYLIGGRLAAETFQVVNIIFTGTENWCINISNPPAGSEHASGGFQAMITQAPAILTPPDGEPNADGVLPSYFIPAQSDAKWITSYPTSAGGGMAA